MGSIAADSKILVIDGSALVYRAYHALPPFTAPDGTPTNAVHGFISMLLLLVDTIHPSHMVVCMDTPKPTFRKKILASYQAQRPPAPDELKQQFPLVKQFLDAAGVAVLLKEGYEADDVIGTITHILSQREPVGKVYVVTGDRDLLQLISEHVSVLMPQSGVSTIAEYQRALVKAKLGVFPEQVVDYKALMGDSSDNYPGVPGIGPKTARDLLEKYTTLEGVYEHLEDIAPRIRALLITHKEQAFLAKNLATIRQDVPVDVDIGALAFKGFREEAVPFLLQYGLKSISKRLAGKKDDDQLSFF